jgi:hypothetical protein
MADARIDVARTEGGGVKVPSRPSEVPRLRGGALSEARGELAYHFAGSGRALRASAYERPPPTALGAWNYGRWGSRALQQRINSPSAPRSTNRVTPDRRATW